MDGYEVLSLIRRAMARAKSEGRVPVAVVLGEEARTAVIGALPSYQATTTALSETVYGLTVRRDPARPWAIDVELDPLSPTWVHPARRR